MGQHTCTLWECITAFIAAARLGLGCLLRSQAQACSCAIG